jgi:diacylglycerol kinase family enzyme
VVVAGGDGTIGYVARALAGTRRRLGILSLGTFNNFALGLGMPEDLDRAIALSEQGKRGGCGCCKRADASRAP